VQVHWLSVSCTIQIQDVQELVCYKLLTLLAVNLARAAYSVCHEHGKSVLHCPKCKATSLC
jgi:hypothetical protein